MKSIERNNKSSNKCPNFEALSKIMCIAGIHTPQKRFSIQSKHVVNNSTPCLIAGSDLKNILNSVN